MKLFPAERMTSVGKKPIHRANIEVVTVIATQMSVNTRHLVTSLSSRSGVSGHKGMIEFWKAQSSVA